MADRDVSLLMEEATGETETTATRRRFSTTSVTSVASVVSAASTASSASESVTESSEIDLDIEQKEPEKEKLNFESILRFLKDKEIQRQLTQEPSLERPPGPIEQSMELIRPTEPPGPPEQPTGPPGPPEQPTEQPLGQPTGPLGQPLGQPSESLETSLVIQESLQESEQDNFLKELFDTIDSNQPLSKDQEEFVRLKILNMVALNPELLNIPSHTSSQQEHELQHPDLLTTQTGGSQVFAQTEYSVDLIQSRDSPEMSTTGVTDASDVSAGVSVAVAPTGVSVTTETGYETPTEPTTSSDLTVPERMATTFVINDFEEEIEQDFSLMTIDEEEEDYKSKIKTLLRAKTLEEPVENVSLMEEDTEDIEDKDMIIQSSDLLSIIDFYENTILEKKSEEEDEEVGESEESDMYSLIQRQEQRPRQEVSAIGNEQMFRKTNTAISNFTSFIDLAEDVSFQDEDSKIEKIYTPVELEQELLKITSSFITT